MSTTPRAPWPVRAAQATMNCDRRILYAVLAGFMLLIQLRLFEFQAPVSISAGTQQFFDTVEELPPDQIVLVDVDFQAGNYAECAGQLDAVIRHLFARDIKVALVSWVPNPEGQKFAMEIPRRIASDMGKEYGEDYCIFAPLTPTFGPELTSLARDIPGFVKVDINQTPIDQVPMMEGVETIADVSLVVRIAYFWEVMPWIGFVVGPHGTKLGIGAAAITSSTAYPFLDAEQLIGLMAGAGGAGQYEQLLEEHYGDKIGRAAGTGEATRVLSTQSLAAAYVVLALLVGNLAHLIVARHQRQTQAARGER